MTTLNISGKKVKVSDGFLKLSPEDQAKTVDEIAASLGLMPQDGANSAAEAGPAKPDPESAYTDGPAAGAPAAAPQAPAPDTWTDTAGAMMEAPLAAAGQFAGGLTGGPSPSRDFLANDPLTSGLPSAVLTGLGGVGDLGGAALSALGAGIAGGIGLATEFVPGQDARDEQKLGNDLLGMSQFAIPELAGASSVAAKAASIAPRAAEAAPAVAAKVAPVVAETPEAVAALVQKATGKGMGAVKAREDLAAAARLNPEAKAAADRLGIDLPADVFSDNPQVKAAAGLTRSEVGKEPEALWRRAVTAARDKASEIMAAMDGSPDIASVSEKVKGSLQDTQRSLKAQASKLYGEVDAAVPPATPVPAGKTVRLIGEMTQEVGGESGLSPKAKAVFASITDPNSTLTYRRLSNMKSDVQKALRGLDSPYGDLNKRDLTRLQNALTEDQLAAVEGLGGTELRAKLREANTITKQQKGLEERIINAFGKDGNGSISSKLTAAIGQGKKGDISGLQRVLKNVPDDLKKEAVASALAASTKSARAAEGGFGLPEFAKIWGGIRENAPVRNLLGKHLGPEAMSALDDLATVSERIVQADANVLRTGKANQVLANGMLAEGLVNRALNTTVGRWAARGAGATAGNMVGGPIGGAMGATAAESSLAALTAARPDKLVAMGKFLSGDEFMALAEKAAQGADTKAAVAAAAKSPKMRYWAKLTGIADPTAWLNDALKPAAASAGAQDAANSGATPRMRIGIDQPEAKPYHSLYAKYGGNR